MWSPPRQIILLLFSLSCSVFPQRLAESAEDADLYHDFNATLEVGAADTFTSSAVSGQSAGHCRPDAWTLQQVEAKAAADTWIQSRSNCRDPAEKLGRVASEKLQPGEETRPCDSTLFVVFVVIGRSELVSFNDPGSRFTSLELHL